MNNSLINMSNYQKVIFVKDLDENNISKTQLERLSRAYPFAVFLTTNKGESHASNIWCDGERLTRFIGIDKDHNKINVGGHSLRLMFNYDNGTIGIYDDNSLKSISIKKISWTTLENVEQHLEFSGSSPSSQSDIDAIDNKFNIVYKFTVDRQEDGSGNAENVSNSLKIYGNNSNIITTDYSLDHISVESRDDLPDSIEYKFTYQINKDTVAANYVGSYKAVSEYSSDITCEYQMRMYINPISYDINASIVDSPESGKIPLSNGVNFRKGVTLDLEINFKPNSVSSFDRTNEFKYMYMKIVTNDPKTVMLNPNDTSTTETSINDERFIIRNGIVKTQLYVSNDIELNSTKNVGLTFSVLYRKNAETYLTYKHLTKQINIKISGDSTENFIYYGYEDPTVNGFDKSKLISFTDKTPGRDVLYDHETDTIIKNIDHSKTMYIAIPSKYATTIKPRLDLYTESGDQKIYVDNSNAFEIYKNNANIANTGIEFIVYRSKETAFKNVPSNGSHDAFYFGKIQ